MKPSRFTYHAPQLVAEAIELLDRFGDDGRILAGGQSLVPLHRDYDMLAGCG